MDTMYNVWELIPAHVMEVIFSKLPIVNLLDCRLVCKAWNDFVLDYASYLKFVPNTYLVFKMIRPVLDVQSDDMYWSVRSYPRMYCIDFDAKYSQWGG